MCLPKKEIKNKKCNFILQYIKSQKVIVSVCSALITSQIYAQFWTPLSDELQSTFRERQQKMIRELTALWREIEGAGRREDQEW